jgi:hypothetical protein
VIDFDLHPTFRRVILYLPRVTARGGFYRRLNEPLGFTRMGESETLEEAAWTSLLADALLADASNPLHKPKFVPKRPRQARIV